MEELIIKSKNGDSEAFTLLIQNIQNDLYRIAKTRLNNESDIGDAIQDTMINAFKHIKNLKDNSIFKSWIIKILINECNKFYKKKRNNKNITDKIENELIYNNSDYSIQNTNSKIDFELLIEELNYDERLVVTLYYNNNFSYNEISKILNINIGTVKSKLSRAKEKVKKYYKGGIYNE